MKFCSLCGAANEDHMSYCYACGATLETGSNPGTKRGLSIPKPVLTIVCIVLAAALLIGGIVWFLSTRDNGVEDAWDRTMKEFVGKEEPTQFQQFWRIANERLSEGEYSMQAAFSGSFLELGMDLDYSRSARALRGDLNLGELAVEYSAKKDAVQIRFPGDAEAYGFKVSDINRIIGILNDILTLPFVGDLIPLRFPTFPELDLFSEKSLMDTLTVIASAEYEAFRESIEIEQWDDETITRAGRSEECRVYKISWSAEALADLLGALSSGGFMPDLGGLVESLLPEMEPYVYCYVSSEDYLVGARFSVAGAKCLLLLEGRENIWDDFTLTAETQSGAVMRMKGAMERNGDAFLLYLNDSAGQNLISVGYDDASGDFSVNTASLGTLVTGRITGRAGMAGIRLNWVMPESGPQELSWSIRGLSGKPGQLSSQSKDLMDVAWSVLQRVITDWLPSIT